MSEQDDELTIEINLRSPFETGVRKLIVAALVRVALAESEIDEAIDPDREAAEVEELRDSLEYGPWSGHVTAAEREFLRLAGRELTEEAILETMWRVEAVAALHWASFGFERMSSPWRPADPAALAAAIPAPFDEVDDYFNQLNVRDEETIALERERAELWAWRVAIREDLEGATAAERAELLATIREAAAEALDAGLVAVARDDFAVDGRPFASTDPETRALIAEISLQRLHALNWLCGYGMSWDDVPLDV
jgi:hypothetical protein